MRFVASLIVLLITSSMSCQDQRCPQPLWTYDLATADAGFHPFVGRTSVRGFPSGRYGQGLLFLSARYLVVYQIVDFDQQRLVPRDHAWNEGHASLKVAIFDVNSRQIRIQKVFHVEEARLQIYALAKERLLLRTGDDLVILSLALEPLRAARLPAFEQRGEGWDIRTSGTGLTIFRSHIYSINGHLMGTGNFISSEDLSTGPDVDIGSRGIVDAGDTFVETLQLAGEGRVAGRIDRNGHWSATAQVLAQGRKANCGGPGRLVANDFYSSSACGDLIVGTPEGDVVLRDTLPNKEFFASFESSGQMLAGQVLREKLAPFDSGRDRAPVEIKVYDIQHRSALCSIPTADFVSISAFRDLYGISSDGTVAYIRNHFLYLVDTGEAELPAQ